jgi:hypothetical protein
MSNAVALWRISLDVYCPGCSNYFNILDYDCEFWNLGIQPVEHDTDKTKGVEVVCPECDHEFLVDLQY